MAREEYISRRFNAASAKLIETMDSIMTDYVEQGYVLTVRQLYYQLVTKNVIVNTEESYKRITSLVNDARLAGLLDWDAIEDRTRRFIRRTRWDSGAQIVESCVHSYHQDLWKNQDHRLFVVVEKEALAGVLSGVCQQLDVPLLAAKGYPSGTVLREFAESDIIPAAHSNQSVVILHLGDHDPSGLDMTRDLEKRFGIFTYGQDIEVRRIALNMDQIDELKPPENPAKQTDARFKNYEAEFGDKSWELDAIKPQSLEALVRENVEEFVDPARWKESLAAIKDVKQRLQKFADEFNA